MPSKKMEARVAAIEMAVAAFNSSIVEFRAQAMANHERLVSLIIQSKISSEADWEKLVTEIRNVGRRQATPEAEKRSPPEVLVPSDLKKSQEEPLEELRQSVQKAEKLEEKQRTMGETKTSNGSPDDNRSKCVGGRIDCWSRSESINFLLVSKTLSLKSHGGEMAKNRIAWCLVMVPPPPKPPDTGPLATATSLQPESLIVVPFVTFMGSLVKEASREGKYKGAFPSEKEDQEAARKLPTPPAEPPDLLLRRRGVDLRGTIVLTPNAVAEVINSVSRVISVATSVHWLSLRSHSLLEMEVTNVGFIKRKIQKLRGEEKRLQNIGNHFNPMVISQLQVSNFTPMVISLKQHKTRVFLTEKRVLIIATSPNQMVRRFCRLGAILDYGIHDIPLATTLFYSLIIKITLKGMPDVSFTRPVSKIGIVQIEDEQGSFMKEIVSTVLVLINFYFHGCLVFEGGFNNCSHVTKSSDGLKVTMTSTGTDFHGSSSTPNLANEILVSYFQTNARTTSVNKIWTHAVDLIRYVLSIEGGMPNNLLNFPYANYKTVWALSKHFKKVKTFVCALDVTHRLNFKEAKGVEAHECTVGLNSLTTSTTVDGIEDCCKLCGGQGSLCSSGLTELFARGSLVLFLQMARYLMKVSSQLGSRNKSMGATVNFARVEQLMQYPSIVTKGKDWLKWHTSYLLPDSSRLRPVFHVSLLKQTMGNAMVLLSRLLSNVVITLSVILTLLYISELALPDIRGLLNALPHFPCSGGMFATYIMDINETQFPTLSLEDKAGFYGTGSDRASTLIKCQKGKFVIWEIYERRNKKKK